MPSDKKTYSRDQKQACADKCGITLSTVSKYVSEYALDASDPITFEKQYKGVSTRKANTKNAERLKAEDEIALERAAKAKIDRRKSEIELEVLEGSLISLDEQREIFSHLGLMTKTHFEALPKPLGVMCEGKSAKEIEGIVESKIKEALHQLSQLGNVQS